MRGQDSKEIRGEGGSHRGIFRLKERHKEDRLWLSLDLLWCGGHPQILHSHCWQQEVQDEDPVTVLLIAMITRTRIKKAMQKSEWILAHLTVKHFEGPVEGSLTKDFIGGPQGQAMMSGFMPNGFSPNEATSINLVLDQDR
ncbi:hypothetical protein VNO77_23360 [Canavalia gladiata]|uniref:Uncharacterized protein n=1 Tax=Canavalia gladiata TaxID=3824 RepID=A0AAN9Q8V3_CANGL